MEKRKIIIGTYDTAVHDWTLAGWKLGTAEQKTKLIDKPNGDGAWDLSTATTDGVIKYKTRPFTASLECSEGTRMEREEKIREIINDLDGELLEIYLPDDDKHHVVGRVQVIREYNDLAHGAVTVKATCEPWKYANEETIVTVTVSSSKQTVTLENGGKRPLVPTITVSGDSVLLEYGTDSIALSPGTYKWPNLLLMKGTPAVLTYSGSGTATFTYREAVLE